MRVAANLGMPAYHPCLIRVGLSPFSFLAVFGAGLLTSLSPCTLSVLPLTIGYIGGFTDTAQTASPGADGASGSPAATPSVLPRYLLTASSRWSVLEPKSYSTHVPHTQQQGRRLHSASSALSSANQPASVSPCCSTKTLLTVFDSTADVD